MKQTKYTIDVTYRLTPVDPFSYLKQGRWEYMLVPSENKFNEPLKQEYSPNPDRENDRIQSKIGQEHYMFVKAIET